MDILLISTNRHAFPAPVVPLGACRVADAAERAGHTVRLLDLMFTRDPLGEAEREVTVKKPDVIGLSVRNIDNNDMQEPAFFIRELIPLADTLHRLSDAPLVLGGAAVAVMPEEILRCTGASYAVLGDGDSLFPLLLGSIDDREALSRIPGIAWRRGEKILINPPGAPSSSAACPCPDFTRWIDVNAYLSQLSTIPLQTKLGCHFKCVYCTYRKIGGEHYRLFSPESVGEAVRSLASSGLRDIEFVDNVFNSPPEHAMAVTERLAQVRHGARLQSLELNPLFVDDALLTAMEHAGFRGIGITVESASDAVLSGLGKGFGAGDVRMAARVVRRHTLPCLWIFMIGGPGETRETIRETLRFAETCVRPSDVVFFNAGVRMYPGTELAKSARREGLLSLSPEEMLEPVFYFSPEVEFSWAVHELRQYAARHMNCISSDSLRFPFLPAIHRLGYRCGIRPPLWRYTRFIRRGLRTFGVDA
ncbi:MAG: cobalamin-dependent protein [Nitrospirales bacterium]|nr:cobalamin-dependent protein [Nitrospirales bacterium]